MVKIEFTSSGSSAKFGNFEPGGTVTCTAAEAKHLIEEARCAKYYKAPAAQTSVASKTAPRKTPAKTAPKADAAVALTEPKA